MENASPQAPGPIEQPPVSSATPTARLTELGDLLESLDPCFPVSGPRAHTEIAHQDRLVLARLGVASSLFMALRVKHPPTAAHCLRVAVGCSSWVMQRELSDRQRDEIEIAALLHDVGKIGVPDHVLLKPGKLTGEEVALMDRHREMGREILAGCCASSELLDIVHYAGAWFDGYKKGYDRQGEELPLGARLVSIVDAFDAMTTDQVYRRAMSRERAMAELYAYAGSQFDPQLVKEFCQLLSADRVRMDASVSRRWLQQLRADASSTIWHVASQKADDGCLHEFGINTHFHGQLLDSMHDGVVFVDADLRILLWNRAAERLTGIAATSVQQHKWEPGLVGMRDEHNQELEQCDCPVAHAIGSSIQMLKRLSISGRNSEQLSVNLHVVPVSGEDGASQGAAVLLHDASHQTTLEERVQTLHEKATRDPLTKVANRAEFDRVHQQFVETHLQEGLPCSLIICDIDHFKQINDVYGHQAGDLALVSFAKLLQAFSRPGDLVARYGGEEFVLLCADCDNATATRRAEEIRSKLACLPLTSLDNTCLTASFGVTELQAGDTPETMLRRADRALLQAKDAGRNRVIQLGSGIGDVPPKPDSRKGLLAWLTASTPDQTLRRTIITSVPFKVAAEKLRGFVADHHAEVLSVEENIVSLRIDGPNAPMLRRRSDRALPFYIQLVFREARVLPETSHIGSVLRTLIQVTIRPRRRRDRRRRDVENRANQLLSSLKSYFMAQDYWEPQQAEEDDVPQKAKNAFSHLVDN